MEDLTEYRNRPFAFFGRYIMMRRLSHAAILIAVVSAVGFSVTTQYGIKYLVDTLSAGAQGVNPWRAFYLLVFFVAADNLLWRVASWIAAYTFVQVTGDLRADLFRYLTGHAPSYFAKRLPGVLTSRITATSNAIFTIENMCAWNILPPCIATFGAIAFLSTVSVWTNGYCHRP
jgi:ATP-binding cassette subfamily B protein